MNADSYEHKPWYLFNGHLESIIPYKTYKIYSIPYKRERIELLDGDFIDVDWIRNGSDKLLIISHAFEGNSRDYFVERAAKYFHKKGYDILMWHFRSCSKEMNRLPRLYHIGDIDDLDSVIDYGRGVGTYDKIFLMGFSMGGATVVNYLGANGFQNHERITAAAVFSVPLDLKETSDRLFSGVNHIYGHGFLSKWKRKIARKAEQYPDLFDLEDLKKARTLDQLHEKMTIKLLGFDTMEAYHRQNSSAQFLSKVKHPLLIVNAINDPLLGAKSYPSVDSKFVKMEFPKTGGHLGFSLRKEDHSWMETRSEAFFKELIK
ncbi:MAG: putative alpha/beta-fold hydrolase [Cyclobacteriaceae bacterium]|jgi:predicted alpha/beta-fold hydrolase